jgi:hypothetical protein
MSAMTPEFGTPDPRAVAYRKCGHRSLSVGDVVMIGDMALACTHPIGGQDR